MTDIDLTGTDSDRANGARLPGGDAKPLRVEKLVYGGEGLSRVDGQVVLMPFVLPGEEVRVTTQRVKTGLLRAVHTEVVTPAAERVQPLCPYFGTCGGCHYQHANYPLQLTAKREILLETLARTGSIRFEGEIKLVHGEPWHYRNRVQLHVEDGVIGFHKPSSHEIVAIDQCPISSPALNIAIASLSKAVQQREWPRFLRSLEVFTNENDVQLTIVDSMKPVAARFFEWCATFLPQFATGAIDYAAAGHTFRISRGSFFQVNRFLVDTLVTEVLGNARGERAVDLYAGVGLFSVPLAERFAAVQAVERGAAAHRDLVWNAREHPERIETVRGTAEDMLRAVEKTPDLIVADPPRAGLGKEATAELLRLAAPEILLVSCDPATLARDLKTLSDLYEIEQLTLIDLFPQTYHFETLARLRKRSS